MSEVRTLFVPGVPRPQPRPRPARHGGRVHTYTPDSGWQAEIVAAWLAAYGREPLQGPLAVRLGFHFGRPGAGVNIEVRPAAPGVAWRIKRPDLDRCVLAVLDALSGRTLDKESTAILTGLGGLAWGDDAQIVDLWVTKLDPAPGRKA